MSGTLVAADCWNTWARPFGSWLHCGNTLSVQAAGGAPACTAATVNALCSGRIAGPSRAYKVYCHVEALLGCKLAALLIVVTELPFEYGMILSMIDECRHCSEGSDEGSAVGLRTIESVPY